MQRLIVIHECDKTMKSGQKYENYRLKSQHLRFCAGPATHTAMPRQALPPTPPRPARPRHTHRHALPRTPNPEESLLACF